MNENQFNWDPEFQQNQLVQDLLIDSQTLPGNYQEEDSENRDITSPKEFPESTQQHDYKNPSADQIENDEEDESDTDGEIFNQNDENNTDPNDELSPDLSDTEHIWIQVA